MQRLRGEISRKGITSEKTTARRILLGIKPLGWFSVLLRVILSKRSPTCGAPLVCRVRVGNATAGLHSTRVIHTQADELL